MTENFQEKRQDPTNEELWEFKHKLALALKDIAVKWGVYLEADPPLSVFYSRDYGADYEYTIMASPKAGKLNIGVISGTMKPFTNTNLLQLITEKKASLEKLEPLEVIESGIGGREITILYEPGAIIMENGVSLDKLLGSMNQIHEEAKKRGLYNNETGIRIKDENKHSVEMPKISIDEAFAKRGTINPVFQGQNPEVILNLYDKPEELLVIEDHFLKDTYAIVHKRDQDYIAKRDEILKDVLYKKDLTVEKLLKKLSGSVDDTLKEIFEIREEVERRMNERTSN